MPTIRLKPNSPEFDGTKSQTQTKHCDMPGCRALGEHKAPKDHGLQEYYTFCLDHVREYNSAWNFFSGMAAHEVEAHIVNSIYGDRPTWRYDMEGAAAENLRRAAWQTYNFSDQEPPRASNAPNRNTPEYEALAIMGFETPVTLDEIKLRYKMLAKKHHPDLNRNNPEAEELLKRINMAYTILKLAYEQFEELPIRS